MGAVRFTAALDWREPGAAGVLRDYASRFRAGDAATLLIHGGRPADIVPVAEARSYLAFLRRGFAEPGRLRRVVPRAALRQVVFANDANAR